MHVVRELRSKQAKAEKAQAKTGKYVQPRLSVKELKAMFPYCSDATVRIRLREKCECTPLKVGCQHMQDITSDTRCLMF